MPRRPGAGASLQRKCSGPLDRDVSPSDDRTVDRPSSRRRVATNGDEAVHDRLRRWRDWFPVPTKGYQVDPIRWLLLEGNRIAVTGALLTAVFVAIVAIGSLWTFQMQRVLTETDAVQTLLNTLLSGIILLVSIVSSISAIVLSYDIASVGSQQERIRESVKLRRRIGSLAETDESPTEPETYLSAMAEVIRQRARKLERAAEGTDEAFAGEVREYVESISGTVEDLGERLDRVEGAEFGVLWQGLEMRYAGYMDRADDLRMTYRDDITDDVESRLDDLVEAFELFATGKEYFKTLYYSWEISGLSRTLLVISLPAILVTASTILAIDSGLVPDVWLAGLPPQLSFVAAAFTVSLAPYVVLTAYMLRVATVAHRTVAAGPFALD